MDNKEIYSFLAERGARPKFIKEFIKFLLLNEAYTAYINNLTFSKIESKNIWKDWVNYRLYGDEIEFINHTLIWDQTFEGTSYWSDLSIDWRNTVNLLLK